MPLLDLAHLSSALQPYNPDIALSRPFDPAAAAAAAAAAAVAGDPSLGS